MKKINKTEEPKIGEASSEIQTAPEKDTEKGLPAMPQKGTRKKVLQNATLTTACLLIGIVIALQYRSIKEKEAFSSSALTTINDYQSKIISLTNEIDMLKDENKTLSDKLELLEEGTNEEQIANLQNEITLLRTFAGLTQVSGPGIRLTVNFKNSNDIASSAALLQMLINEIKAADAQAISVNGERIVAMSETRVVNSYLVVNGKMLTQPFEISVIGDRKSLMSTLNMAGGVLSILQSKYATDVSLTEEKSLTINAFTGTLKGMQDILDFYNYKTEN